MEPDLALYHRCVEIVPPCRVGQRELAEQFDADVAERAPPDHTRSKLTAANG